MEDGNLVKVKKWNMEAVSVNIPNEYFVSVYHEGRGQK